MRCVKPFNCQNNIAKRRSDGEGLTASELFCSEPILPIEGTHRVHYEQAEFPMLYMWFFVMILGQT